MTLRTMSERRNIKEQKISRALLMINNTTVKRVLSDHPRGMVTPLIQVPKNRG